MSRAKELSIKTYPLIHSDDWDTELELMAQQFDRRVAYVAGYEEAEAEIIERACDWLFAHLPILVDYYNEDIHENADRSEFIKLFRKQMEEE